jgi:hypothetical protein
VSCVDEFVVLECVFPLFVLLMPSPSFLCFRIYRAAVNHKIAAPVCFISLSAPSITMYAMTIMAQPSPERISEMADAPDIRVWWHEIHRKVYLPVMHFMFFLSLIGMASSLRKW